MEEDETIGELVSRLRTVSAPKKAVDNNGHTHIVVMEVPRTAYVSPVIYYKKTLSAVHAHASGRDAKRITAKEQDIFEWGPGWTVPPGAPCQGKIFIHEDEPDVQTPTE